MVNTFPTLPARRSEEQKFQSWLDVELAACAAWSEIGAIPPEDVETLYDVVAYDVVASTRAVSETLGEEKKWVHNGLTSTDVADPAHCALQKALGRVLDPAGTVRWVGDAAARFL